MEYTTLSTAVQQYHQEHKGDQNFQKLGAGSFGSWKVTVLLHNQENDTWKFEDANIFQRMFWKIAKYVPFLKSSYEKVNLDQIHKALVPLQDKNPAAIELMERVDHLWKLKMNLYDKIPQTSQQQGQEKQVKNQSTTKPLEQTSKDISAVPKEYEWVVPKDGKVEKMEHDQIKVTVGNKSVILQPGKFSGHGEYGSVKDRLNEEDRVDEKLCHISDDGSTPDVMLKIDGGKVRVYQGPLASTHNDFLVYQEYNTVDEAINDYKRLPTLSSLLTVRQKIMVMDEKNEWFVNGIRHSSTETIAREGSSQEMKNFLEKMLDGKQPLDKKGDLDTVNALIAQELLKNNAKVEPPLK